MTVTTALDHPFWCDVPTCDFTNGWDHETGTHAVELPPLIEINSYPEREVRGLVQQCENYGTREAVVYSLEGIDGEVSLQELDELINKLQELRRRLPFITAVG